VEAAVAFKLNGPEARIPRTVLCPTANVKRHALAALPYARSRYRGPRRPS
jgi:hypothetical protein